MHFIDFRCSDNLSSLDVIISTISIISSDVSDSGQKFAIVFNGLLQLVSDIA